MIIPNNPNTNFAFCTFRIDDLTALETMLKSLKAFFDKMYEGQYPSYRLDRILEEVESTINGYLGRHENEV